MDPVTQHRIQIAKDLAMVNVDVAAKACRDAGLPFYVAMALLEKESPNPRRRIRGGANVWGGDIGGVGPGRYKPVTALNFTQALVQMMNGATANGVGPCQITFAGGLNNGHRDGGFFREMLNQELRPWVPQENMLFGFKLLASLHRPDHKDWVAAGARYNGAIAYGQDLNHRALEWRNRLGIR